MVGRVWCDRVPQGRVAGSAPSSDLSYERIDSLGPPMPTVAQPQQPTMVKGPKSMRQISWGTSHSGTVSRCFAFRVVHRRSLTVFKDVRCPFATVVKFRYPQCSSAARPRGAPPRRRPPGLPAMPAGMGARGHCGVLDPKLLVLGGATLSQLAITRRARRGMAPSRAFQARSTAVGTGLHACRRPHGRASVQWCKLIAWNSKP